MKLSSGKKLESLSRSPLDTTTTPPERAEYLQPSKLGALNQSSLKHIGNGEAAHSAHTAEAPSLKPLFGKGDVALGGEPGLSKLPSISQGASLASTTPLDSSLVILKPIGTNDTRAEGQADAPSLSSDTAALKDEDNVKRDRIESEEKEANEYENEFIDVKEEAKLETDLECKKSTLDELEAEMKFMEIRSEPKPDIQSLFHTKREIDSALYSRILMMRPRCVAQDLLHAAVADQDLIGVQMVLSELGEDAPLEILRQDNLGRNCIHIAAMYPSTSSLDMVGALLGCLSTHAEALLKRDLLHLSKQFKSAMASIRGPVSPLLLAAEITEADADINALLLSDNDKDMGVKIASLQRWYEEEQMRIKRRTEFHIEMWRIRALGSRDCDGRTPLHYAAINGSKAQLSVMLAKKYKGRFVARDAVGATTSNSSKKTQNSHAASNAKRGVNESEPPKDLVLRHVVYNTLTGEAVGKLESAAKQIKRNATVAWENSAAMTSMNAESAENIATGRILDSVKSSEAFLDNEVIVPWVLRNMVRRASDLSRHMNVTSAKGFKDDEIVQPTDAVDVLKELLDEAVEAERNYVRVVDAHEPIYLSSDGFKSVLSRLGISLTSEVLQEVISRYLYYGKVETAISEFDLDAEDLELFFDDTPDVKTRTSELMMRKETHKSGSYRSGDDKKKLNISRNEALPVRSLRKSDEFYYERAESKDGVMHFDYDRERSLKASQTDKDIDVRQIRDASRRRQLLKASNAKVASELKRLALTQYVNVDLLMDDIETGKGLTSLDLRSLGVGTSALINSPRHKILEALGSEPPARSYFSSTSGFEDETLYEPAMDLTADCNKNASSEIAIPAMLSLSKITELRRALVNIRDSNNCTPLHLAVAEGDRDVVSLLIDEGADVTLPFTIAPKSIIEDQDPYGTFVSTTTSAPRGAAEARTYTSMALARNPSVKSVLISKLMRLLLKRRLNIEDESINAIQESGLARSGGENIGSFDNPELELLSYIAGSEGQKLNFSRPLLSWAVSVASFKTVKQIVTSMNINVNEKDSGGRTALHEIASLVCQAVERRESRSLDDPEGGEADSSCIVLENGSLRAMLEVILENGGDPDLLTVTGRTALHELFSRSSSNTEGSSLSKAKSSRSREKSSKTVPNRATQERRGILRSLLRWGADYSLKDRQGLTPLHYCAKEDAVECLRVFLNDFERGGGGKGIGPYSKCLQGRNVLHVACSSNSLRCIDLLLRWDVDNVITAACEALLRKDSGEAFSTCLSLDRDMRNKTPMQLIGASIPPERQQTFWESCYFGNKHLVEQSIRTWRTGVEAPGEINASQPLWEDVGENATLLGIQNEIMTRTSATDLVGGLYVEDEEPNASRVVRDTSALFASNIWTMSGIDSKTRLHSWSPLHCCIIGWACTASLEKKNLCAKRALQNMSIHPKPGSTMHGSSIGASKSSNKSGSWGRGAADTKSSRGLRGMCHAKGAVVPVISKSKEAAKLEIHDQFINADHLATALLLLKNRAFINALDEKSRTPLMIAAACNLIEAVSILLEHGADLALRDSINGSTALHYAYAAGSMAAASVLEERGADLLAVDNSDRTPIDVTGLLSAIGGGVFA